MEKLGIVFRVLLVSIFISCFVIVVLYFLSRALYALGSTTCTAEMCVNITSPSGKYYTNWLAMNLTSTSGNTEYFSYNLSYTFCPEEGTYSATFIYTPTGTIGTNSSIYTVNYDNNSNWCYCYGRYYGKTVAWGLPGDYVNKYCCGDDPNEYIKSCSPSTQEPCTSSTSNQACCDASTDCVYNGTCYSEGTAINVNGLTYTCSLGGWTNCAPPSTGDWIVGTSCVLTNNVTVNGNLKIVSGGTLTINGATLRVTGSIILVGGYLQLVNGGKLIKG